MTGDSFGCVWEFDGKNGCHMDGGMTPMVSFFRVNQEGKRVMNEYGAANVNANNTIVRQMGNRVYCFMDSTSTEGPFYASCYQPFPTNCLAGLESDEYCRLPGADSKPIPGLYGGVIAVQHQLGIFQ